MDTLPKRQTAYQDENILFQFEFIKEQLFVHVVFKKVSKAIIGQFKTVWKNFKDYVYWQGYEDIFTYTFDPRIIRMVEPAKQIGYNNKLGGIYQWVLN